MLRLSGFYVLLLSGVALDAALGSLRYPAYSLLARRGVLPALYTASARKLSGLPQTSNSALEGAAVDNTIADIVQLFFGPRDQQLAQNALNKANSRIDWAASRFATLDALLGGHKDRYIPADVLRNYLIEARNLGKLMTVTQSLAERVQKTYWGHEASTIDLMAQMLKSKAQRLEDQTDLLEKELPLRIAQSQNHQASQEAALSNIMLERAQELAKHKRDRDELDVINFEKTRQKSELASSNSWWNRFNRWLFPKS